MKKRILALALAFAITMGLGNSALAEVLPESVSASPGISEQQEDSASPEVTEAPEETIIPEVTQAPEETATPEVTEIPQETATPEATKAPMEDEGNEDSVQAPILEEPYALPGVEDFAVTQAAPEVTPRTELPSGEIPFQDHLVNGLSPSGTTIDLFDYWLTEQTDVDVNDPQNIANIGINDNHALLFRRNPPGQAGQWNSWTGNKNPRTGIVNSLLGDDGYPQLSGKNYGGYTGRNNQESLDYLFNPNISVDGKESFKDVKGLLQVDEEGYYYYNSQENYAVYYADTNSFALYDSPGVKPGGKSPMGQFFPFNEATVDGAEITVSGKTYTVMNDASSLDSSMNHYFGVHMSTRFIQQYNGHTDVTETTPVTYEFSGDDDVWIFIDGVLVADLGGIHDAASVSINFATGEIKINDNIQDTTLGSIFEYNGNTLPNDTYHTLDFFYLERGNVDSNMNLKYNLVTIPESSLIKVDQIGDPVPGAQFTLYAANDIERRDPIATGTTNADGEFVFLDENDFPITIQKLYENYKDVGVEPQDSDLVLVETVTPAGYRSNGDIGLYFYRTVGDEVLLLSNSVWDKGAYAMSKVTATTPNKIRLLEMGSSTGIYKEVTLVGNDAVENPLMFAVVYQKQEDGTWRPVSGDPINGWKVEKDNTWGSVLSAARANPYIFQLASSGAYQVEINNLPGDIKTYYHICKDETTAKYTIGYYYTEANTLGQATAQNTWRIDSDPTESGAGDYALMRVFSMDLYVTNIKNRLLVQKVDDEGKAVNGAVFSLYSRDSVKVSGDTVKVNDGALPVDSLTTKTLTQAEDGVKMDGGGVFPTDNKVLAAGEYYLIETSAPFGYKLNDTAIHVVVDNTGVYADAGTKNDGVSVLRGVGSVIRSMVQFAAEDDVDTTLYSIKAALASDVTYSDGKMSWGEAKWDGTDVLHLEFANEGGQLDYGPNKTGGKLAIETTEGWSKLLIRQCTEHKVDSGSYTDLAEQGKQDITNLFSGTVTVRVENEPYKSLRITKQVEGVDKNSVVNQNYSFTVSKMNDNDNVDTSYQGKVQVRQGNGTPEEKSFENGVLTVTRQGVGSILIYNLSDGIYRVIESGHGDDTISVENGKVTWQSMSYQAGENATATESYAVGKIDSNAPDKNYAAVTVSNHYAEVGANQTLTVTKEVDGNMGDKTKDFTFTLEVKNGNQAYKGELTAIEGPKGEQGTSTTLTVGEGSTTFDLKHNEQIAIHIPKGYTVKVTETAVDGYTTKWRSYTTGTEVSETNPQFTDGTATETITMNQNYTVDYLNKCDMQVPTGVDTQNPGSSVMLGVAAASAVLIFGCSFLVWRRRRRDWM